MQNPPLISGLYRLNLRVTNIGASPAGAHLPHLEANYLLYTVDAETTEDRTLN